MSVRVSRALRGFRLETELTLPVRRVELFPFFSDARNLERLTPPQLRFEVLTPDPIEMREGLLIDYRLRLRGVPVRWQSEISAWDPPRRFVDRQRRGPYRWWIHEHRFEEVEGKTLVTDSVEYGVPGGGIANALFVRGELVRIFEFRRSVMLKLFAGDEAMTDEGGHAESLRMGR